MSKQFKVTIIPMFETAQELLTKEYETIEEAFAAKDTAADLLLFLQDDLEAMRNSSNLLYIEELMNGEWEEVDEHDY